MSVSFINKLFKSKSNNDFCTAVVLAAGNSQRMGKDKILMPLGDIGGLFPDNDDSYLGADSIELLKTVVRLLCDKGYGIVNADCTVIAQRPKLKAYIESMRQVLASAMGVELDTVSVKATTEEHLGFTGEGLGIAAHAVVLIN